MAQFQYNANFKFQIIMKLVFTSLRNQTYLVTQCAAVNTHWVPINAPPQRYWFSELINATCQHHSAASASSPPTTLEVLDVPLTPHTYLLYVDGLDGIGFDVVNVETVGFAE